MPKIPTPTPTPTPKDYYASVMLPGTKKITIVSKRVGTTERLFGIATCTNETVADKIVNALNLQQGEIAKLEAPAQQTLEDVREQLTKERALTTQLRLDVRKRDDEIRTLRRQVEEVNKERDRMRLCMEAAQSVAREKAL